MDSIRFGTDGWRGIIADDFTFPNVARVTQAIANYIIRTRGTNNKIVIGYDNRFLSDKFAQKAAGVLAANGISVMLSKTAVPTPVTAYMVKHTNAAGALMITASHNPYYYNGIKFIPEYAGPAHSAITQKIEEELVKTETVQEQSFDKARKQELIQYFTARDSYFKHLDTLINKACIKQNRPKIVVDYLHGAAIGYVDSYLESKAQVCVIRDAKNPLFSSGNPDPRPENLTMLQQKVKATGADIGIAFDGDGDRFGVIDDRGVYYSPNQVFTLLLPYLLKTRKLRGSVYRTVSTTHQLDRIAADYGIPVVETPVGFKHIAKGFLYNDAIFGVEESGGMSIRGHIPEKDGILASMLTVEMIAQTGKTLHQLWAENCSKYGRLYFERIDMPLPPEKKRKMMEHLRSFEENWIGSHRIKKSIEIDGRKFIFDDDSWCLIRPSGTENAVRVYLETPDMESLKTMKHKVLKWLDTITNSK